MRGCRTLLISVALCAIGAPAAAQTASPGEANVRTGSFPHHPGEISAAIHLAPGEELTAGTCGLPGSRVSGDTVLSLVDPAGQVVAQNDDGCPFSLGSRLHYRVPVGAGGAYRLRFACFAGGNCGGQAAYRVGPPEPEQRPAVLRIRSAVMGLVAADGGGAASAFELRVDWWMVEFLALRASTAPVGLGGGRYGGLAVGGGHLSLVLDLGLFSFGLGGGVAVIADRAEGDDEAADQSEAGICVVGLSAGYLSDFRLELELAIALHGTGVPVSWLRGELAFSASDEIELSLRGSGGGNGMVLVDAVLRWWFDRSIEFRRLALSFHAGGGGVFYRPLCRFGGACLDTQVYAGPVLGMGLEWRVD